MRTKSITRRNERKRNWGTERVPIDNGWGSLHYKGYEFILDCEGLPGLMNLAYSKVTDVLGKPHRDFLTTRCELYRYFDVNYNKKSILYIFFKLFLSYIFICIQNVLLN